MPAVRIRELPIKTYPQIDMTNIMVIEDNEDTKQITVEELKLLFSSDEKMNAIAKELNDKLDSYNEEIQKKLSQVQTSYDTLEKRVANLFDDHEQTKRKLGKIQEDLIDAQNDIKDIQAHLVTVDSRLGDLETTTADHEKRIKSLESRVTALEPRVDSLEKDNEKNKKDISQLQIDVVELNEKVDREVSRLDHRITTTNTELREYIDHADENLMKYIDYYHHTHEYPPNFDEPYLNDPIVARYIHPVGTIYETVDPTFEIAKWFPGTWVYCGTGAAYDKDNKRMVDYYTWRRTK